MEDAINVVFSARLKELMSTGINGKRVTQQDLAAETGYTRQAISQYMDGSVLPNIEKLYAFAKLFGVSADYLLGLTDAPTTDKDVQFVCDYTGLSEKAVEVLADLKSNYGRDGGAEKAQSIPDTVCALIEEYDAAPFRALLHMIRAYPVNGFRFDGKDAKHLTNALDDFMQLTPSLSSGIDLQEVIQTAYLTKLYTEIQYFKHFQYNRFAEKPKTKAESVPHVDFLEVMRDMNASNKGGNDNGDD